MKIIDISEHNGNINFSKVKQDGIDGVIIRVGWIGNSKNHCFDKKFEEYYSKAKYYGLKIGFYVYSYCKSVSALRSGVNWLLNIIENRTCNLPVFLDLEDNTIKNIGSQNLTNQAVQFCKILKNNGYKSGVYASRYWFLNILDINKLLNYKIWLAEWNGKENHTLGYKVDLWQYTSKGKVNGIVGNVDMNKCLCDCVEEKIKNGDDVEVKTYQNGGTPENVFADVNLTNKIGTLNPKEKCDCLGVFKNRPMVRYKIDNSNNYKIGFVEWIGGVK